MYSIFFLLLLLLPTAAAAQERDVLVPAKDIKRGEVIEENDLVIESLDVKSKEEYFAASPERNKSLKAKRNLAAGKPIKKSDLIAETNVIHKGDIVTAKFIKKNLTIEVQAIAMSNAKLNETVRLKTTNSNKIIIAKVREDGSIVVMSD